MWDMYELSGFDCRGKSLVIVCFTWHTQRKWILAHNMMPEQMKTAESTQIYFLKRIKQWGRGSMAHGMHFR